MKRARQKNTNQSERLAALAGLAKQLNKIIKDSAIIEDRLLRISNLTLPADFDGKLAKIEGRLLRISNLTLPADFEDRLARMNGLAGTIEKLTNDYGKLEGQLSLILSRVSLIEKHLQCTVALEETLARSNEAGRHAGYQKGYNEGMKDIDGKLQKRFEEGRLEGYQRGYKDGIKLSNEQE